MLLRQSEVTNTVLKWSENQFSETNNKLRSRISSRRSLLSLSKLMAVEFCFAGSSFMLYDWKI